MSNAIPFADLFQPATAAQFESSLLSLAQKLGIPSTAWQPGSPTRTEFAVLANVGMLSDVEVSILAQAGFLDYAATGSVTYIDPETQLPVTQYVTPDPSIPAQNPTGDLGALDVLADSVYDVQRILSTFAGGVMALLNTSVSTYGPFTATTYHVAQPTAIGSPTYSNAASLTIAPSATVGAVTGAVTAGGVVKLTVTAHGLSTGATVFVVGVVGTTEANGAWVVTVIDANHFTLNGSTFANAYVSGGTVYTPTLAAFTADAKGTASNATSANVVTQPVTSLIGVSVRNVGAFLGTDVEGNVALAARCRLKLQAISTGGPKGAYLFFALASQLYAPHLTPPLVLSAAVTRALVTPVLLTGTVVLTIANSAGGVGPGDVAVVDAVEQAYAVPTSITLLTQSAVAHNIAVAATLYVPNLYVTAAKPIAEAAVAAYFQRLAIGGVTDPAGPQHVVPIEGVRGAIEVAMIYAQIPLQDMTMTLDGGSGPVAANITLALSPVPEVAVLVPAPATITMVGV